MEKITLRVLHMAESAFLWALGWRPIGNDLWQPPADYPFRMGQLHRHGHAVNASKIWVYDERFNHVRTTRSG